MSWFRNNDVFRQVAKCFIVVGLGLILGSSLMGCRGARSEKPPVHPNPNMDWQSKFKAQTLVQTPPAGTVAWGNEHSFSDASSRELYLGADTALYEGKQADGRFVKRIPIPVSKAMMVRGQERYGIYCAMCHGESGSGKGMVIQRGFIPPPALYADRLLSVEDGYLFDVITHGVRNMPGYAKQIMPQDRWAIVAYIRALQKTQKSHVSELPESVRSQLN